jgi:hypothetical protein
MLIKLGLRGDSNVIIHLGNLLIDNILDVEQISNIVG